MLAIAAIAYVVDFRRLIEALRLADYRYIFLLLFISLGWLLMRGVVWRALLQEKAGYRDVFLTLNQGYLLNNVLPLRLGEIGRAFLLSRKTSLGFLQVLSTIVIERALDLGFAALLLLTTLPFVVGADFASNLAVAAGVLVVLGLLALHLLARNRDRALQIIERLSQRFAGLRRVSSSRQMEAFFDGLAVLVDARRFLRVALFMALNWGISLVQFYVLLRAFFPQVQPLWAGFTLAVMALGAAAPSSPGAVGVLEGAVMAALAAFKVDPSTALAAAILAHLTNYLLTGLIGAYAFVRDGLSLTGVFRQVRSIEPAATEEGG